MYLIGPTDPFDPTSWVLVDAGLSRSTRLILDETQARFDGRPPRAIILTHGHFDHVGALGELMKRWGVPIYAHEMELPYLTGRSNYPPPDRTVGGGLIARMAWLFPSKSINLGPNVYPLPPDGTVPFLPDWRWIPTPGHSPGHVSLFRDNDRVLIAGDAFVTTKQESLLSVLTQFPAVHGPPAYFTPNWSEARESIRRIVGLRPALALTGHGPAMEGEKLADQLTILACDFDRIARPRRGRYVDRPAVATNEGVVALPPAIRRSALLTAGMIVLGVGAAVAVIAAIRRKPEPRYKKLLKRF